MSMEEDISTKRPGLCVIRPYHQSDMAAVGGILETAAMETVSDYFWSALFSELAPQVAFVVLAIGFIGLRLPTYLCLVLLPIGIIFIYIVIWSAHKMKVSELHGDLLGVPQSYQDSPDTGFWVAEVHDHTQSTELNTVLTQFNKKDYEFITQDELNERSEDLMHYKYHTVVACIAVASKVDNKNRAWIKRFAVTPHYRRRSIATNLLEFAMEFAQSKHYDGIQLTTTDCHQKAREMYLKEGFEVSMISRSLFNVSYPLYIFTKLFPENKVKSRAPKGQLKEVVEEQSQPPLLLSTNADSTVRARQKQTVASY